MTVVLFRLVVFLAFVLYQSFAYKFSWPPYDKLRVFEEKRPPIDDEEYLRRCPSDLDPDTALKVRNIIADVLGIDAEEIHPDHSLMDLEFLACG